MYLRSDGTLSALPQQDGPQRHTTALVRRPRGLPKPATGRRRGWRQPIHFGTTFLPGGQPVTGHYQLAGGRFPVTTPPQILRGLQALGDDQLGLFGIKISLKHPFGSHSVLAQGGRAVGKVAPLVALVPGVGIPAAMALSAGGKFVGKVASGPKIGKLKVKDLVGSAATGAAEGAAVGVAKLGAQKLFAQLKGGTPAIDPGVAPAAIDLKPPSGMTKMLDLLKTPVGGPSVTDIIPAADVLQTTPVDPLIQRRADQAAQAAQAAQVQADRAASTAGQTDFLSQIKALLTGSGAAPASSGGGGGGGPSVGPAPDSPVAAEQAPAVAAAEEAGLLGGVSPTLLAVGVVALVLMSQRGGRARGRR